MAWIESGDPTAVGDLGFGDTCCSSVLLLSSLSISFASSLESCVCGTELLCVEGFTMPLVYFKTVTSGAFMLAPTSDGRIDFSALGREFKLDPKSIKLNDIGFSQEGLKSEQTWEQMKAYLIEGGSSVAVGTKEDLVVVTGEAPVPTEGFSHSKRPRIEDGAPHIQSFVESAAKHYRQWEQAEKAGVKNGGRKSFLVVNKDPFGNHPKGFVVWIRKCYRDLKEMLTKAEPNKRFVFLGTAGIGKSVFTLFWICYLATLKQKVVWKFHDAWYLLDFSKEGSSSAKWVSDRDNGLQRDLEVQQVLEDPNAWLIIDGKQPGALHYGCHMLLACSDRKENYHQFAKNQMCSERFVPVWSEEEFEEFLDDFEAVRVNYSHMGVPTKDVALENFGKLGGVPRYALCSARLEAGLGRLRKAVQSVDKDTFFKYLSGAFEDKTMSDSLIHIKCMDESYGFDSQFYDFASPYVQNEFGKRFRIHF